MVIYIWQHSCVEIEWTEIVELELEHDSGSKIKKKEARGYISVTAIGR